MSSEIQNVVVEAKAMKSPNLDVGQMPNPEETPVAAVDLWYKKPVSWLIVGATGLLSYGVTIAVCLLVIPESHMVSLAHLMGML